MFKEYGKLSATQLRALVALLPELEAMARDFHQDVQKSAKAKAAVADDGVWWAGLYELPFEQHLAACLRGFGLTPHLMEAIESRDPQAEVLKWMSDDSFMDRLKVPEGLQIWNGISLVMSIERSLESLMVWGRYLNELVAQVREGDDPSLLKAVRIDPTVVSCPSVAVRISGAVVMEEKSFLRALRHAMEGKTDKQAKYLRKVRYAIQALQESGVQSLSDKELIAIFDTTLGIYKDAGSGSAAKALRKHWTAARRKTTT